VAAACLGRRTLLAATACSLALLLPGCGGRAQPQTELMIKVTGGIVAHPPSLIGTERFRLRCHPDGGVPEAKFLCAELERHPKVMLLRGGVRSSCIGGPGLPPDISLSGHFHNQPVHTAARECDNPRGAGVSIWLGALPLSR
jgi:hypothetical protein